MASSFTISRPKQFLWLSSVFCGIIICKTVYKLTGMVSLMCFKGYGNLSIAKKIEWNNSEGYSDELIINRTSAVSETVLGISIGYFLSDLAMILWTFPALGGLEYVLHHGLSMFSIFLALVSGQGQIYILMVLFSEITTPFVNLRWYLDVAGQKSSNIYIWNGVALFLGWLVARILLFIYFFIHMAIHFDQVKEIFPLGFYSMLTVPPVLAIMNVIWFWKIFKGLIKTLSKARHRQ
ncbi:TLC domain-containing protein 4 isoform X4 [Mangifera indica]|uniref:TLC domain-containing protein 4 isoform X4 n=1 Tax=Mangifera indica TaxID=29780 RepID=UPI001CFA8268|nr:TLC domain-containing protein 4 isoform X4 [Mangifera indica]